VISHAKAHEAARVLDLVLDEVTKPLVRDAFRECAKTAHPDVGGTPERFERVKWAHDVLLSWLSYQMGEPTVKVCRACSGKGFTQTQRGFTLGVPIRCVVCSNV
jgi:DnaJ-class molecular chaperone